MNAELWQKICESVDEALVRSPAERESYLQNLQNSDPEVHSQVIAMIGQHERSRMLLNAAPLDLLFGSQLIDNSGNEVETHMSQWPTKIGDYSVSSFIGKGGMGAVLRIYDATFDRDLALKVALQPIAEIPELRNRFFKEAFITGKLQHPGIPPVHETGKLTDGRPFFIMKLIEGETLSRLLKNRTNLEEQRTYFLGVFEQICQTIAYAHQQGIIHRDLKSSNIMVGAFGEVQVMDWGLAKQLLAVENDFSQSSTPSIPKEQQKLHTTKVGDILGTPAFMSPEQARGEVHAIDKQSDVFGLGAILCEIMTGEPPFVANDSATVLALARKGDLEQTNKKLNQLCCDSDLRKIIDKCIATQKTERFSDGTELATAFTKYLEDVRKKLEQEKVKENQARIRAEEEQKRAHLLVQRSQFAMALAVSVLILVVGGSLSAIWYQQTISERRIEDAKTLAEANNAINATEKLLTENTMLITDRNQVFQEVLRPESWLQRLAVASKSFDYAQKLANRSDDENLHVRLDEIKHKVDRAKSDQTIAKKLEDIRLMRGSRLEGKAEFPAISSSYSKTFQENGIPVNDLKMASATIRNSHLRQLWLAALDDWALVTLSLPEDSQTIALQKQIMALANEIEDSGDPWLAKLRNYRNWNEPDNVDELAKSANCRELPIAALLLTYGLLKKHDFHAADFLQRAYTYHANDFWLNLQLGIEKEPSNFWEAIGYLRAAQALKPQNQIVRNFLSSVLAKNVISKNNTINQDILVQLVQNLKSQPNQEFLPKKMSKADLISEYVVYHHHELKSLKVKAMVLIQIHPNDPEGYKLLADVHRFSKDFDEAAKFYKKCNEKLPPNSSEKIYISTLISICYVLKQYDFETIPKLRKKQPPRLDEQIALAEYYLLYDAKYRESYDYYASACKADKDILKNHRFNYAIATLLNASKTKDNNEQLKLFSDAYLLLKGDFDLHYAILQKNDMSANERWRSRQHLLKCYFDSALRDVGQGAIAGIRLPKELEPKYSDLWNRYVTALNRKDLMVDVPKNQDHQILIRLLQEFLRDDPIRAPNNNK